MPCCPTENRELATDNWFSVVLFFTLEPPFAKVVADLDRTGQNEYSHLVGVSRQTNVNLSGLNLDGIGLQVDAGRSPLGFAGRNVESPLMPWALNDFANHQAIRQTRVLVSANSIGRMKSAGRVVDGVDLPAMLKLNDVLFIDVFYATNRDPGYCEIRHSSLPLAGQRSSPEHSTATHSAPHVLTRHVPEARGA